MSLRLRLTLALALGLGLACIVSARPAPAMEPTAQGWWTSTEPGPTPADGALPGGRSAFAVGVPEDGLLVEGGAGGPRAYSALHYDLGDRDRATVLRLTVADEGTIAGSAVIACPLIGSFVPAQGGPISAAPAYDCETVVPGEAADGVYAFAVESLVRDGNLSIALLPADPSDRVAFTRPAAGSLEVTTAPPPEAPEDEPSEPTGATEVAAPPPPLPAAALAPPTAGGSGAVAPVASAPVATALADALLPPPAAAIEALDSGVEAARDIPLPLLAAGALAAAALWLVPSRVSTEGGVDLSDD